MSSSTLTVILLVRSEAPHTWRRLYPGHRSTSRYRFAARNFNLDRAFLLERFPRRLEDSDDIGSQCSVSPVGIVFSRRVVFYAHGKMENLLSQGVVGYDYHTFQCYVTLL